MTENTKELAVNPMTNPVNAEQAKSTGDSTTATANTGMASSLLNSLKQVPGLPQLVVLLGISLSIAIGVAVAMWAHKPEYRVLYTGLSPEAKSQVVQALDKLQIEYQINQYSGDVLVPPDKMHRIKMQLANEGINTGDSGLEIIHDEQAMGVSQFIEGKRYHHALEIELGRTIASLHSVSKARVHLAVPKSSSFVRNKAPASASVLLHLFPGRSLSNTQVKAIEEMVASSIPNLNLENVSVVDQRGNLLSGDDSMLDQSSRQFDHIHKLEEKYVQRIKALLAPIVGYENISAQVSIDMDFSHKEETLELYNPEKQVVRSERSEISGAAANANVAGVPGSLSNQPVSAKADKANKADVSNQALQASQVQRNYEIDKTLSYKQKGAGEIMRISASVIVNKQIQPVNANDNLDNSETEALENIDTQKTENNKDIEQGLASLSEERIEALVKTAIGFSAVRGDSVTVLSTQFAPIEFIQPVEPSWFDELSQNANALTALRYLLAAIILLMLVFKVIKPTLQSMLNHFQQQRLVTKEKEETVLHIPEPEPILSYEEKLSAIRERIAHDPMTTAQVLKSWVREAEPVKASQS